MSAGMYHQGRTKQDVPNPIGHKEAEANHELRPAGEEASRVRRGNLGLYVSHHICLEMLSAADHRLWVKGRISRWCTLSSWQTYLVHGHDAAQNTDRPARDEAARDEGSDVERAGLDGAADDGDQRAELDGAFAPNLVRGVPCLVSSSVPVCSGGAYRPAGRCVPRQSTFPKPKRERGGWRKGTYRP